MKVRTYTGRATARSVLDYTTLGAQPVFVAEAFEAGEVVGHVVLRTSAPGEYVPHLPALAKREVVPFVLDHFHVKARYRQRGIGRELMRRCLAHAKDAAPILCRPAPYKEGSGSLSKSELTNFYHACGFRTVRVDADNNTYMLNI